MHVEPNLSAPCVLRNVEGQLRPEAGEKVAHLFSDSLDRPLQVLRCSGDQVRNERIQRGVTFGVEAQYDRVCRAEAIL